MSHLQPMSEIDESAKKNALIAYALMAIGFVTGLFWIVGAIWAMVKKSDAQGSIFEDHYINVIKTFWWGLGLSVLGAILSIVFVGYIILFVVWVCLVV